MELAIGQIIKIIIAVLVFAVVVISVSLGFRNYIIPYFSDTPADNRDLTTPYYQELINQENVVGVIIKGDKAHYISINGEKTAYYFWKNNVEDIYRDDSWIDDTIGEVDKNGIIAIKGSYLKEDARLGIIDRGEKIGNEIYKMGGANG